MIICYNLYINTNNNMFDQIKEFYRINKNNNNTNNKFVEKNFPLFYEMIKDDFDTKFWCVLNNIDFADIPVCENCNGKVQWEKGHTKFKRFCSFECFNEFKKKCKDDDSIHRGVSDEILNNFKNYITTNDNIIDKHKIIKSKKIFPDVYNYFSLNGDIKTNIYMFVYDIDDIPECGNPECGNKVTLKNMIHGFRKCCCNSCVGKMQSHDSEHKQITKNKPKDYNGVLNYTNGNISKNGNYITFENYCEHGDLTVYWSSYNKDIFESGNSLCAKCNNDYISNYDPTEGEMEHKNKWFVDNYDNIKFSLNENNLMKAYPEYYKIIFKWSEQYTDITKSERIYLYKHLLKKKPKCILCDSDASWKQSSNSYNNYCEHHCMKFATSKAEMDVYDFIHSYTNNIKQKYYINNREFDMIYNDKLLIEYNGLYWHSDAVISDKSYHLNKLHLAKTNNKDLFVIWEDDWNNNVKRNIIKSMLLNKINCTPSKVYARELEIRTVSNQDAEDFLTYNHIQGYCKSKINYGLYYNDVLYSIMTFGKTRMITNSTTSENDYELLRFCNKLNHSIVGGASKLFKHFIKHHEYNNIISYANSDFSNGKIYEILGFEFVHETPPNYWWCDKQRHHRSKFMKHKLVEEGYDKNKTENEIMHSRGYNKIWGYGNLKYVYRQKK